MCGICGIYDRSSSRDIILSMGKKAMQTLNHRGPDDEGEYQNDEIFLGHKRLSIIDISENGRQPMLSNDGQCVCIFNGEIFNYLELRDILITKGYSFNGHSDSEVIPNLYQEFGIKFLDMIKGMFAIAIYDIRTHQLFLVRDRLGVKPLYYFVDANRLIFGSELKAILVDERVPRKVDHQAIYDFLSFSYIPDPSTGFENIYSLLPGNYLTYDGSKAIINKYKKETAPVYYRSPDEACVEIKKILENTVKLEMASDVQIGAFLSGGIDSSLLTTFGARASQAPINTFTVKFDNQEFDESYYAKIMSKHVGSIYNELHIEEKTVGREMLKRIVLHFDQPFGDSSSIPTYLISMLIRDKVKVALSGDGGDDFFGGYEVFWRYPFVIRLKKIPAFIRQTLIALLWPLRFLSSSRYRQYKKILKLSFLEDHVILQNFFSYLNEVDKKELYIEPFLERHKISSTSRIFKQLFNNKSEHGVIEDYITKYSLPGDMLKKVDMMSMKASIEARVPFLYMDVVEASKKIPEKWKFKFGKGKLILRKILATEAPEEIINKKKWGFGIPLDKTLSQDAFEFIMETLNNETALIYKFVKKEKVKEWVKLFYSGTNDEITISRIGLYQRIYMLLSLELWLQKFQPAID